MPGLKWPHQPRPRHVESIADDQVKIWSFKQDRHKDVALENGLEAAPSQPLGSPKDARRQKASDRLGFSYWGDAIATELTRLMHTDENSVAFLNEGMNVEARALPGKAASDQQPNRSARRRRSREH